MEKNYSSIELFGDNKKEKSEKMKKIHYYLYLMRDAKTK